MSKKELKDMSIADILVMPLYYSNIREVMHRYERSKQFATRWHQRHPVERIENTGDWTPGRMTTMYAEVMNKVSNRPTAERRLIYQIGTEAFNKTMKTLQEYEEKGNNNNGKD